jgi:small-conductance mechanosensitive channel/CRP-like cAMP-binding protein
VDFPYQLVVGVVALAATLALRAFPANRVIRGKLRLSVVAFGVYLLLAGALAAGAVSAAQNPQLYGQLLSIGRLLVALGTITLVVVAAINPWRVDRTPEQFPNIVQDAIITAAFLVVGTSVMGEKFLTTSAVGAVVIGFALQDTLGNTFAGLAIQVEKPFRVGHWVRIGAFEGRVVEINWRATLLQTKSGDAVIVPNNIVSKEAIVNYSQPSPQTRLFVDIGASYATPPNDVRAVVLEAVADAPLVVKDPPPKVVIADFAASAVTYRIKFWVADFALDDAARDQVRSCVYYAFRRHGIEIPYPIQAQYMLQAPVEALASGHEREEFLAATDVFAALSARDRARLAAVARERLYGAGQTVIHQGQPGSSMFVICRGSVRVTLGDGGAEVATLAAGAYFGEMSLLTGEPRTATVTAVADCLLLEIAADDFRAIALAEPAVVEQVTGVVAQRRVGLERTREAVAGATTAEEAPRSFLLRVRQFLRL